MLEDSTNKGQVKEGKMGDISYRKRVKKVEKTSFFFLETLPPPPPPLQPKFAPFGSNF